jgi:hypothetical protein
VPVWGFLMDRLDHRIAVSPHARDTANRWLPGEYEILPNGVLIPPEADPHGRATANCRGRSARRSPVAHP